MSSASHAHRSLDLLAMDHLPQCPTCDELAAPGATVCECGQRLVPGPVVPVRPVRVGPTGCTCGGNGVCLTCYFAELDGDLR